jgi:AraC family transcriptional regulator
VEQLDWRREADRPMGFVLRATSKDRGWTGFEAHLYETTGGIAIMPAGASHSFSMHLSPPIEATCGIESTPKARLQAPGDIDFVPAGYSARWQDFGKTIILGVRFSPSLLHSAAEEMGLDADAFSIPPLAQLRDPKLEYVAMALKAELENDEFGRIYAESLGTALATHLMRRYATPRSEALNGRLSKRRFKLVTDYIHEHLAEDLSLGELAGVLNMSPSHFKTLFREAVGMPVHQYVIRQRVDLAVSLLVSTNLSLTEIAMQSGFSNQSHLARFMRRLIGASPAQLRRT